MATAENESRLSLSSEEESPPPLTANYVRVLLLNATHDHVLMRQGPDRWDLPYFEFPWGLNDDVAECCLRFQSAIGFEQQVPLFVAVAELLGYIGCYDAPGYGNPFTFGFSKLLFVEPLIGTQVEELPRGFEWKNLSFVAAIHNDTEYDNSSFVAYEAVLSIMKGKFPLSELMPSPPFQPGWFQSASDWLLAEISKDGVSPIDPPFQYMLSHTSGILTVASTSGFYFLKGTAAGCSELIMTQAMANLFPRYTPELVSVNEELQAFITRGFHEREIEPQHHANMLRMLGTLQKNSVQHVESLIAAGVPTMLLQHFEETLNGWAEDSDFASVMRKNLPRFKNLIPTLVQLGQQLADYNLPMCVVHGDFARRNIAFKEYDGNREQMLLHDWQYGAISHPFFDFHGGEIDDGEEAINAYFSMWTDYVSLEEAQQAYELAVALGTLLKMRGALEGVRKEVFQKKFGHSQNAIFCSDAFSALEAQVRHWKKKKTQQGQT